MTPIGQVPHAPSCCNCFALASTPFGGFSYSLSNICANQVRIPRFTPARLPRRCVKRCVTGSRVIRAPSFFSLGIGLGCAFMLGSRVGLRLGNKIRGVFGTFRGSLSGNNCHSSNCFCKPARPEACFIKVGVAG